MTNISSYRNSKLYLIHFLIIFLAQSSLAQIDNISFSYEEETLKTAIKQIINKSNIPLIYPGDLENQKISETCNECNLDSALTILLSNTNYDWKKIQNQYTIYKLENLSYNVSGRVFDYKSNETIPYANIYIPKINIGTISDNDGFFTLRKINTKNCSLNVSYIGYKTSKKSINMYDDDIINIYLNQKILPSKHIFIGGKYREFLQQNTEPGRVSFSPKHISSLPNLGEVDIFRSLQLIPGIHQGLAGTAELYIRGGTPDQNIITMDGMTIYQKTHMFGFISSAQASAVKDIQVYKADYPIRFGGQTSGLIEVTNRVGDTKRPHIKLFSNLTTNSLQLEAPLFSRGSLIITSRVSNNILTSKLYKRIQEFVISNDRFNSENTNGDESYSQEFKFNNNTLVLSYLLSQKNRISLTHNEGSDLIIEKRGFFNFNEIFNTDSSTINEDTKWANKGTILNWSYYFNKNYQTKISISKSEYKSSYNSSLLDIINNDNGLFKQTVLEKNSFSDNSYNIHQIIKSIQNHDIKLGITIVQLKSKFLTNRYLENNTPDSIISSQTGYKKSIYGEDKWDISKKLYLKLGFRDTFYSQTGKRYFSPRASLSFYIYPNLKFQTSLSKLNKFTHQYNNSLSTRGTNKTWILSDNLIPVSKSENMHTSIYLNKKYYELSISYYLRHSNNIYDFNNIISPIPIINKTMDNIQKGSEKTSGSELFFRIKNQQYNGWISYQYNSTQFSFNHIDENGFFPADHDLTHEFKTAFNTSLFNIDFTATWSYTSGRVFTNPQNIIINSDFTILYKEGTRNRERLKPVHHLDFSILKTYKIGKTKVDTGLSIYNIYNKKNISHKKYNPFNKENIISDVIMLGITPTFFIQLYL